MASPYKWDHSTRDFRVGEITFGGSTISLHWQADCSNPVPQHSGANEIPLCQAFNSIVSWGVSVLFSSLKQKSKVWSVTCFSDEALVSQAIGRCLTEIQLPSCVGFIKSALVNHCFCFTDSSSRREQHANWSLYNSDFFLKYYAYISWCNISVVTFYFRRWFVDGLWV